jgi:hypothetical protein
MNVTRNRTRMLYQGMLVSESFLAATAQVKVFAFSASPANAFEVCFATFITRHTVVSDLAASNNT